jgi:acyl-CoA dehydrogenase
MSLRERAEELAAGPLRAAAEAGEAGRLNRGLIAALAEHGLLGEIFRRDADRYLPTSAVALCQIREGLARHCTEAETAFALQGLGAYPMLLAGGPSAGTPRAWAAPGSTCSPRTPSARCPSTACRWAGTR